MAVRISQHTAIPYFDQANYVLKAYGIADLIAAPRGALALADPRTLLATPPASRGALLPLAAAIALGPQADTRAMALLWLAIRLIVLLLALVVLARVTGSAAFVPAAVMVFLASPSQLMLNPSLYMMDQAFECFGLLACALMMRDVQVRSAGSAALAAAAVLALAQVKPAAVVFIAPLYAVAALTAVRAHARGALLARWALPHVATWALLLLLAVSPYGAAVRSQYQLGRSGYWWRSYAPRELMIWAVLLLPTWLGVLAVLSLLRHGRRGLAPGVLLGAGLTAAWWYAFNTLLTYTVDPRVIAAATPVAVSAAALVACRTRGLMVVATAAAGLVFGLALASASGRVHYPYGLLYVNVIPRPQEPVAEVGLRPLVERTAQEIERTEPGGDPISVMTLVNDDFIDSGAMSVALRQAPGWSRARVRLLPAPWGSDSVELERIGEVRWFLTKARRRTAALSGDAWTLLDALDALIVDPASPLHSHFERRFALPVRQPDLEDEVELWRQRRTPTAPVFLTALRWVEPRFRSTPGHAGLLQRIATTADALSRLPLQTSDGLRYHIDGLEDSGTATRLNGWAFVETAGSRGSRVFLLLQPPSGAPAVFNTARVPRPDVSAYFKRSDLDESGFTILLPHEGIQEGTYRVGLYVAGPAGRGLRLTGDAVVID